MPASLNSGYPACKKSRSKNICVVDKFQNKKNILSKFKVKFINIKKFHLIKKIKFSRVIDTTGNVKIINLAFDNVSKNGHLIKETKTTLKDWQTMQPLKQPL